MNRGRASQDGLAGQRRAHLIRAQHVHHRVRVRRRHDILRGDLAHPRHSRQDDVELADEQRHLVIGEVQASEMGQVTDVLATQSGLALRRGRSRVIFGGHNSAVYGGPIASTQ